MGRATNGMSIKAATGNVILSRRIQVELSTEKNVERGSTVTNFNC